MTINKIVIVINKKKVFYKYPIIPLEFVYERTREDLNSEGARCYKGKGFIRIKTVSENNPSELNTRAEAVQYLGYFARSCSIGYWQFSRDILAVILHKRNSGEKIPLLYGYHAM